MQWIDQFSSSLAAAIAYGVVGAIGVWILRWLRPSFRSLWDFVARKFRTRSGSGIVRPTERQTEAFSKKRPPGIAEWNDAIDFVKQSRLQLTSSDDWPPNNWFYAHFESRQRTYQVVAIVLAVAYFVSWAFGWLMVRNWSLVLSLSVLAWELVLVLLAFIKLYLDIVAARRKRARLRAQIRDAMRVISPGVIFTYGMLGEMISASNTTDIESLQAELDEIGISLRVEDLHMAQFLQTASDGKLMKLGLDLAKKATDYENLPPEKQDGLPKAMIELLRKWPVGSGAA